eukprot:3340016-Prymnesium_polylepis.1
MPRVATTHLRAHACPRVHTRAHACRCASRHRLPLCTQRRALTAAQRHACHTSQAPSQPSGWPTTSPPTMRASCGRTAPSWRCQRRRGPTWTRSRAPTSAASMHSRER